MILVKENKPNEIADYCADNGLFSEVSSNFAFFYHPHFGSYSRILFKFKCIIIYDVLCTTDYNITESEK